MTRRLGTMAALAVSIVLGISAWFLPDRYAWFSSVAALAISAGIIGVRMRAHRGPRRQPPRIASPPAAAVPWNGRRGARPEEPGLVSGRLPTPRRFPSREAEPWFPPPSYAPRPRTNPDIVDDDQTFGFPDSSAYPGSSTGAAYAPSGGYADGGGASWDDEPSWVGERLPDGDAANEPEAPASMHLQAMAARIDNLATAFARGEEFAARETRRHASDQQALYAIITGLKDEVRRLNQMLEQSRLLNEEDRRRGRWSAIVTFFGGIAISIPIGVIINLTVK